MKMWHWMALILLTLLSIGAQFLPQQGHGKAHWYDQIPGFWAAFGFAGCVLIIVVSKAAGKLWLQRKEDYYERH